MSRFYLKAKQYFTPALWLSLFFLAGQMMIYQFFDLSLNSVYQVKALPMLLAMLLVFWCAAFFYQLLFTIKQWRTVSQPLIASFKLTGDYCLKVLPFLIFLYIYDSIHDITHLINANELDVWLIKIDRWLLLGNDIALLFEKIITPELTAWFAWAYLLYFVFYLVDPIVFYFLKQGRYFTHVLTAVMLTNFIGLAGYIAVPCVGPVLSQRSLFSRELVLPSGELYQNSDNLAVAYVYSRGAFHCFPSLHFGTSVVWLYFAWRFLRREKYYKILYYLHWPAVISLWLATLYLRWHYVVDWLGGLIVALLGIWLTKRLLNWQSRRAKARGALIDRDNS